MADIFTKRIWQP